MTDELKLYQPGESGTCCRCGGGAEGTYYGAAWCSWCLIEDSLGMPPRQAVEDGAHERTSPASDTEESAGAGPGPGDGVESSPARGTDITHEQARNVLDALAEEGLTVDRDGFVMPLEPADFGVVPGCEVDGCDGVATAFDGEMIVCSEHAPWRDDATLELELFEAPMCDHPLSREDVEALESIKAAVRRKLGET